VNDRALHLLRQELVSQDKKAEVERRSLASRRWFVRALASSIAGGVVLGTARTARAESCGTDTCSNTDTCVSNSCNENTCSQGNFCDSSNTCMTSNTCTAADNCSQTDTCSTTNINQCVGLGNSCKMNVCTGGNDCTFNTCATSDSCGTDVCGINACNQSDSCSVSNECSQNTGGTCGSDEES
jgi:hypothetical protein